MVTAGGGSGQLPDLNGHNQVESVLFISSFRLNTTQLNDLTKIRILQVSDGKNGVNLI